jgi:hypothetical protein
VGFLAMLPALNGCSRQAMVKLSSSAKVGLLTMSRFMYAQIVAHLSQASVPSGSGVWYTRATFSSLDETLKSHEFLLSFERGLTRSVKDY